ncbi:MAG: hypothetical protein V4719_10960 [Planctomycetota bacterium]
MDRNKSPTVTLVTEVNTRVPTLPSGTAHVTLWCGQQILDPDKYFEEEQDQFKKLVGMHHLESFNVIHDCVKIALEHLGYNVILETVCDD